MRINRYVAAASGLGRRKIDKLITEGRIKVDGQPALIGQDISTGQKVSLDGNLLKMPIETLTIMLNKPTGYVVSREGQGSLTIYSLLPEKYQSLKPIGRLDKDSSGLLLLSNEGEFINSLAHPSFGKQKIYEVRLNKRPTTEDLKALKLGIKLNDGLSRLGVIKTDGNNMTVSLSEGRNRQIRRTFEAIGLDVTDLHRTTFGPYRLADLAPGSYREVNKESLDLLELTNV